MRQCAWNYDLKSENVCDCGASSARADNIKGHKKNCIAAFFLFAIEQKMIRNASTVPENDSGDDCDG